MLNTRVIVTRYGGPEAMEVIEEPLRPVEKDEIRVKVQAAGVALADVMRREGVFPSPPALPFTPGYDAVGIVDELGEDVRHLSPGQKVAAFFNGTGGYAAYVYAKADEIVPIPAQLDAEPAAAALLNYVTAYQMLHRIAKVSEGDRVLIHGAGGGTGTALLELGRLAGLKLYGTASAAKHDVVSRYGATPIDYRNEDFVQVLRTLSPGGIDAIFDPIGGPNYERSLQTLSPGGRFVGYGYTSVLERGDVNEWVNDWQSLAGKKATASGNPVFLYSITALKKERPDWFQEDAFRVIELLASGKINPLISRRAPLRDAAQAQQMLKQSVTAGKMVLIP